MVWQHDGRAGKAFGLPASGRDKDTTGRIFMKLAEILKELTGKAILNKPESVSVELGRGLYIYLRYVGDTHFWLGLARFDVYPSEQEVKTVLKHWQNGQAGFMDHTRKKEKAGDRYWVYGVVTLKRSANDEEDVQVAG